MNSDLERFITAQQRDYATALAEVRGGCKLSHWMWYIFPQIAGLGYSSISVYYSVKSPEEARDYLENDYLRGNLVEICRALLALPTQNPVEVFGYTDAQKLRSSMTLFDLVATRYAFNEVVFRQVLDRFFDGREDAATIQILETMY